MRTQQIPECSAVAEAFLAMAMIMTPGIVSRTHRAGSKGTRNGTHYSMGRGMQMRHRKGMERGRGRGKGRGRQWRKGRGKVNGTGKGMVLLNIPERKVIPLVTSLCSCRGKCRRQTQKHKTNKCGYIWARSITHHGSILGC